MKPTNRFYAGGPALDPPEDWVMINCRHCRRSAYSTEWIKNRGCPRCGKPYDGPDIED